MNKPGASAPAAGQGDAVTDEQLTDVIQIVRRQFGGLSSSDDPAHWAETDARARRSIREALAAPTAGDSTKEKQS